MHRCWAVPEVLRLIFLQLAQNDLGLPPVLGRPQNAKALSCLARTCRRFSDPALDILWRRQYTLLPLLQCFPPHLWEFSDTPSSRTFHFRSPIGHSDWDRVLSYSSRIREISLGWDLPVDVLELLIISAPVLCLLPNIQELTWRSHEPGAFPYIRLFLGPQLTAIKISIQPTVQYASFLSYLTSNFPSLLDVSLHTTEETIDAASTFVSALTKVRTLSVTHLRPKAYQHLSSLSTLKHLTISQLNGLAFPDDAGFGPYSSGSFPSLTVLSIYTGSVTSGTDSFMEALSNTPLEEFEFVSDTIPSTPTTQTFFSALRDHCSHSTLRSLHAAFGYKCPLILGAAVPSALTPDLLRPVLAFTNLRYMTVITPSGFRLDDTFCIAMAKAWPHIEELNLDTSGHRLANDQPHPPSTVKLVTLASFARHCPRLTDLQLAVTALEPPAAYPPPPNTNANAAEPRACQTALRRLTVFYSPIESPFLVARFLSAVFPSLRDITTLYDGLEDDEDPESVMSRRWTEVEGLIPMFAAVRSDEEKYWTAHLSNPTVTS
ncbi:hypothetical protein B0H19DRAFT_380295 [Mycena capillaripes]|nr:hypothetical protein B0H19DRAFT_102232 [Mycena capillaripes]KAJ6536980.1 hypothetical protein B0H19DRAFT_380295 [Mycena capillaripes]